MRLIYDKNKVEGKIYKAQPTKESIFSKFKFSYWTQRGGNPQKSLNKYIFIIDFNLIHGGLKYFPNFTRFYFDNKSRHISYVLTNS